MAIDEPRQQNCLRRKFDLLCVTVVGVARTERGDDTIDDGDGRRAYLPVDQHTITTQHEVRHSVNRSRKCCVISGQTCGS